MSHSDKSARTIFPAALVPSLSPHMAICAHTVLNWSRALNGQAAIPAKYGSGNRAFPGPAMSLGRPADDPDGLQMIMEPWQEKSHQVDGWPAVKLP